MLTESLWPLFILGDDVPCGTYVLRMRVAVPLRISFGRFQGGKVVDVESGDYVYVGSAMASRGSTCLSRRLVRHASRSDAGQPHLIRNQMLRKFPAQGLCSADLLPPTEKSLRWNVDHLLDQPKVELVAAYIVRNRTRLEPAIADMIEADPTTIAFEPGLGASDRPGHTHLLRASGSQLWWDSLPRRLARLLHE